MLRVFSLALIAAVCSPALFAQGRVAISVSRPAAVSGPRAGSEPGVQRGSRVILSGGMRRHSFARPSFFYGYGAPYSYSDYYEPYQEEYARPEPPVLERSRGPEKSLPAVLIYRDGHSEEISSYSIIGRVIYAKSDYWTNGA